MHELSWGQELVGTEPCCAAYRHATALMRHSICRKDLLNSTTLREPPILVADCAAKQRLVTHVGSINWNYEPAGGGNE